MRKRIAVLILALSLPAAGAQLSLTEEEDNPQFNALLQQQKLGTCERGTYGASLDADDDDLPYDLNYKENAAANDELMAALKESLAEEGSTFKLLKTVNDSPISFIRLIDIDGDKMADRYVYLSGYEFNEWCWLK
ncbi:hypothetical protein Deipr_0253 [Deinococcus proteolyticus MRP]|uniref:Secreted protein n=1 Tax=Deinococcus proteolyticus (strain ATCC 35074 / DSM 20540 / JCM 6276 / NBRC 101906 / NCIMB 13154 / VKM Ac-1939 / CCM 2703 / MRP) TaxID=693977 RepID=F0RJ18_DEIPM|nr:hypothetical protein [Deinococcus proteolyticus]ADY25426.1 hypothetical protein Deipr_0253 [Deinococcus proteolyticus MRP]